MPKLVPLLREGASDLERSLLAAAREDAPPNDRARAQTLKAVAALSSAGTAAVSGANGWRWLHLGPSAFRAWFAAGIGVVAAAGGGAIYVSETKPEAPRTEIVVPPLSAPARNVPSVASAARPAETTARPPSLSTTPSARPEVVVPGAPTLLSRPAHATTAPPPLVSKPRTNTIVPAETAPTRATEPAPSATAPAPVASAASDDQAASATSASIRPPPPPASSLKAEAALLESVRSALASSRSDRALAALDEYAAHFPSGALSEEASVLRVEALLAAGRTDDARRAAALFEQTHPSSSYAPSLRARVGAK